MLERVVHPGMTRVILREPVGAGGSWTCPCAWPAASSATTISRGVRQAGKAGAERASPGLPAVRLGWFHFLLSSKSPRCRCVNTHLLTGVLLHVVCLCHPQGPLASVKRAP